ncbi:unnamed protein product [Vitrella brassicaformis CCMP3155]|uniref:Trimethylguanosine synthase n=1 Tax=Vitrella brassicaformis (strain CCMP3155) TaxID=1169540 RepID=A0A0G4E930_VITBC|nr:unnamed protein product [Vitrella brassicaformis CCMP3155]|eukprot:CEL92421.1 unnamed protein product [Vitrella brassicaformis CCMP3155]
MVRRGSHRRDDGEDGTGEGRNAEKDSFEKDDLLAGWLADKDKLLLEYEKRLMMFEGLLNSPAVAINSKRTKLHLGSWGAPIDRSAPQQPPAAAFEGMETPPTRRFKKVQRDEAMGGAILAAQRGTSQVVGETTHMISASSMNTQRDVSDAEEEEEEEEAKLKESPSPTPPAVKHDPSVVQPPVAEVARDQARPRDIQVLCRVAIVIRECPHFNTSNEWLWGKLWRQVKYVAAMRKSLMPKYIADAISSVIHGFFPGQRVLAAFCGVGGQTASMAAAGLDVRAIDINNTNVAHAKHNARVHGVAQRVCVEQGDFFDLAGTEEHKFAAVHLDAPWGPAYCREGPYRLDEMGEKANMVRAPRHATSTT